MNKNDNNSTSYNNINKICFSTGRKFNFFPASIILKWNLCCVVVVARLISMRLYLAVAHRNDFMFLMFFSGKICIYIPKMLLA